MFDFFVSHSSNDKLNIVDNLVTSLKNMGYSVWYDKNEILVGDNISSKIQQGLENSYCLILILTSNFVSSKWTFYEMGLFDSKVKNRIIPIIYDLSEVDKNIIQSILGNRKYIDGNATIKNDIIAELARTLNRTKNENKDSLHLENLQTIQKKLASYETVNTEIISIKLKEYLDLLTTNKEEFLALAAKKIVSIVATDLLKNKGVAIESINTDYNHLTEALQHYTIGSQNFREYVSFVLNQNCEQYNNECTAILNHALANILTYYIYTKYPVNLSFSQIEIAFPDDLTYKDFVDMFEIDQKVMRPDLIADVETTYGWFKYNKFTHIAVRDVISKKTVGYFSLLPVTEETYNEIISGNFEDKDFTSDSIEQYIFSDFYRLYIAGVGIEPQYQNTGAFIKLYNALIDLFISLATNREIYISEILAEASTKQGEKFCKMVGMKKISTTKNDTDIYKLITIPPEFRLRNRKGKELYDLYKHKFEEFRDFFDKS